MKKLGYTLIELLIVIAIIGILIAIGTASFLTAQKQARDASRKRVIDNIQSAFEQYYAETNNYPASGQQSLAFDTGIAPEDPVNSGEYVLSWTTATAAYCICAKLETGVGNASNLACSWSSTDTYYCAINRQ